MRSASSRSTSRRPDVRILDPHDITGVMPVHRLDPATDRGAVKMALVCVSGQDFGKAFRVTLEPVVIGRGPADIALSDSDVSRRHARSGFGDAGFEIEDLGSANGTMVNGRRVDTKTAIRIGDRIQIARCSCSRSTTSSPIASRARSASRRWQRSPAGSRTTSTTRCR